MKKAGPWFGFLSLVAVEVTALAQPVKPPRGYARIRAGAFVMGASAAEELTPLPPKVRGDWADDDAAPRPESERRFRQRRVTFSRDFWLSKTETTYAQWKAVMGVASPNDEGCKSCAVTGVSFFDALAYANKLSAAEGLVACYAMERCTGTAGVGRMLEESEEFSCEKTRWDQTCTGYRLPTSAEFEYAARAGGPANPAGDLTQTAWFAANGGARTSPVGKKRANAFGLFDMLGNAAELTWGIVDRSQTAFSGDSAVDPVPGGNVLLYDSAARSGDKVHIPRSEGVSATKPIRSGPTARVTRGRPTANALRAFALREASRAAGDPARAASMSRRSGA